MLGIPETYWNAVVEELVDHRYICGVTVKHFIDGSSLVLITSPRVTMEGVAFAQENSMMSKAKAFLQNAKAAIPFI